MSATETPTREKDNAKAQDEEAFLTALGLRVRRRREAAGYTRKALALHAGLSERYLAQLELGSGNVSMLLLRKLARALECPLSDLTQEDAPGRSHNQTIESLVTTLRQLSEEQLNEVSDLLDTRYGEKTALRRSRIALIGLRGAGKSTIGSMLARDRQVRFIELDQQIERELGSDLSGIFSLYGQDAYRDAESRVLERLLNSEEGFVLATGGSIVTAPDTYATLRSHCFTVWLSATPEDHMERVVEQGDLRPMHGREHAMSELRMILQQRQSLYGLADLRFNTSEVPPSEVTSAVLGALD